MTPPQVARARTAAARSWWADMVQASVYLVAALGVAFFLADGGLQTFATIDYVYSAGRALGIVAAVFMLAQVLLISRAPFIERAIGHFAAAEEQIYAIRQRHLCLERVTIHKGVVGRDLARGKAVTAHFVVAEHFLDGVGLAHGAIFIAHG